MDSLSSMRLSRLPMAFKLLFTAALMTLGTGYIFALANIALKIGFSPDQAAERYYGNEASRRAMEGLQEQAPAEGDAGVSDDAEEFSFDDLEADQSMSDEPIVSIPTFEAIVSEGHFHLFGYTTIFFVCGLVIALADLRGWLKNALIVAPFAASVLDIWSMLLTRFVGPGFAWLLVMAGMVMAMSFLLVFVIGIYQLWFLHPHTNEHA